MEFLKFIDDTGLLDLFQGIADLLSLTELFMIIVFFLLLLILFSLIAIRKRSSQLYDINRKLLYELNQLNLNITNKSGFDVDNTKPM